MESSSSHSKISFFDHSKAENRRSRACAPDRAARDGRSKSFRTHEVFLSFRGKDTRASFTSFLRSALEDAGINIFFDDSSLPRGDDISTSLKQAIKDSQISIIVFSTNYANSRWCLDELMNIMTCRRTIGQKVLPVFYDVDPSEVRRQTGKFGNAFQNLLNKFSKRERQWREVLRHAAGLAGFVVLNSRNQNEVIKDIILKVTHLLDKTDLFIANNPVGVKSRVRDMIELLFPQPNHVELLGMWGMGGVGKTTIAKAVYNEIGRNFESRSFLANIREVWEKNGSVHLQEQLLCDIFKGTTTTIRSIDSGKNTLKERLKGKRVLIVLDDVNELEQLDALCGSRSWFGSGSRIIITTRDMNILRGHSVEKVFRMKEMDEKESIELFSWHAFKQASPREDFARLSSNVVEYSGRLPLALEVLGRYLFNREVTEWDCLLEKLRKVPNEKVQKKLKISYDGLDDDYQKAIFLDIACFFIGMDQNDVKHILNGCGLFAENGISALVERSLVTVDDKNKLGMHDLLRDMGREIICGNPQKEPEERSRLWFHEDVDGVLSEKTGTKTIEGLALNLPRANAKSFNMKAFEKLEKLRLLQLSAVQLDGDFKYLSKNLRWLSWNGFPLTCLPTNFYQGNLVSIELENSNVNLIWEETPMMEKLKILNLSHSHYLTQTPDFSKLPNLEKLVLADCPNLSEISHTIGDLSKILLINLEDCVSLRSLPRSIYKLKSLKTLILSGCSMIDKLEEDMEQMESFTTLIANNIAITMRMEHLKILNLSHSHRLTQTPNFSNLPNLENLVLKDCPSLTEVSSSIGYLNKVLLINLEDCVSLPSLPKTMYKLKSLQTFILSGCLMIDKLEEDLEQMESLTTLIANNTAIARVPFSVVRSKSIGYISLCGYEGLSRDVFPSIIWSWMSPTNNLQEATALTSFLFLLNAQNSCSQELPSISEHLSSLRSLWVDSGSSSQLVHDVPVILEALNDTISKELESTATTSQASNMETSALIECCSQVHINYWKSLLIQMGMNCKVTNILKGKILQDMDVNGTGGCLLPGDSYPDWLVFSCEGSSVTFEVPQVEGRNLKAMMCIFYSSTPNNTTSDGLKNMLVINHTKATIQMYKREALTSLEDEEGQRIISSMEPGNKVEVVVVFGNGFVVAKTTIYLIYDGPIYEKVDEGHAPDKNANIVCSADENKCVVSRISPQLEPMDDFIGTASCCGLVQCSFIQWIAGFMCSLVGCWGNSS